MSPDFEYFLRLEPYSTIGHSISGLALQALPLSVIFAYAFHCIIKGPLVSHLPSVFNLNHRAYRGLSQWRLQSVRAWLVFAISVAAGFFSHVFLDAFTHQHGAFVVRWEILQEVLFGGLPVYKVLQHSLSLLGLAMSFIVLVKWLLNNSPGSGSRAPDVPGKQKLLFWLCAVAVALVVTGGKLLTPTSKNIIGILVVAPISGLLLGLLVSSALVWCLSAKGSGRRY